MTDKSIVGVSPKYGAIEKGGRTVLTLTCKTDEMPKVKQALMMTYAGVDSVAGLTMEARCERAWKRTVPRGGGAVAQEDRVPHGFRRLRGGGRDVVEMV